MRNDSQNANNYTNEHCDRGKLSKRENNQAKEEKEAGQIDLYRQALEGATGKKVKEAYLFLFDTGEFVKM